MLATTVALGTGAQPRRFAHHAGTVVCGVCCCLLMLLPSRCSLRSSRSSLTPPVVTDRPCCCSRCWDCRRCGRLRCLSCPSAAAVLCFCLPVLCRPPSRHEVHLRSSRVCRSAGRVIRGRQRDGGSFRLPPAVQMAVRRSPVPRSVPPSLRATEVPSVAQQTLSNSSETRSSDRDSTLNLFAFFAFAFPSRPNRGALRGDTVRPVQDPLR